MGASPSPTPASSDHAVFFRSLPARLGRPRWFAMVQRPQHRDSRMQDRAAAFGGHQQDLGGGLPMRLALILGGQGGDIFAGLAQRGQRRAAGKGNRIVERLRPVGGVVLTHGVIADAAARSSLSEPRIAIIRLWSGNGRCSAFASSQGARSQTSRSSSVVRITGMALG